MKSLSTVCTFVGLSMFASQDAETKRWIFEATTIGALPKNWTTVKMGEGMGNVWKILEDPSAPKGPKVLAQTSVAGPSRMFNLCVADQTKFTDVDLNVAMKAVEGKIDQGGGLMWRYKDANNYYIARMNPLEENFRVYKVVDGTRKQLGTADVEAPAGKWHTIRIVHKGDHIQCYLNGKAHLDVKDDTFKEAGKIGLWTKADAVTSFDDLSVSAPAK